MIAWTRAAFLMLMAGYALLSGAGTGVAHETTRSYVSFTRAGADLTGQVRVAFRDIEVAVWMDEDLDGKITWGEAERRVAAADAYVRAGLAVDAGGACALTRTAWTASTSTGIDYLDLDYSGRCPGGAAALSVTSRLFSDIDPDHRMFLQLHAGGDLVTAVLSRAEPAAVLAAAGGGAFGSFASFFRAGAEHLMAGADHILFLMVLIFPAVVLTGSPGRAAGQVLTAVTGFTLAHALTLTAATTAFLRPPPDIINALIALSIVVTAIDNIWPFLPAPRAAVAAVFGMIHGFGFASALGALQLTGNSFVLALLGFNLGIEAAQIGIVALAFPALYMLGGGTVMIWLGSAAAGLTGAVWLWVRLAVLM